MRRYALALIALATAAACAGGGQPCFDGSSLIQGPQVLAIRTDPPQAYVDLTGAEPIAPVGISALVVRAAAPFLNEYGSAPLANDLPSVARICLLPTVNEVNAPPGCPDGAQQIWQLSSVPTIDAPFLYTPPLSLLQAAVAQDPVHGLGGIQLLVEIDFDGSTQTSGPDILRTSTTLQFVLKGSPQTLNHNFAITGIESSVAGVHTSYDLVTGVPSVVGQPVGVRPLIGPLPGQDSAIETYQAYDHAGVLTTYQEHITYAFYDGSELFFGQVLAGNRAIYTGAPGSVADEPPVGSPDPPDGLVSFEAVFPGEQSGAFWVVARDDRGGVTWARPKWSAVEERAGCNVGQFGTKCPKLNLGCE